ncbi:DNA polymerase III subunit gamma/tau [Ilumatobacter sp.]|uniref:DNA polymerase III subunit gamma/tau n=1 Tax=Ilumatobacter sp. TaxID=1967498 RepID=UPI003B52FD28
MATQSLYRRYRPRRFGELKGQDHVVRALRSAVAEGREGQAYLFSGPRGTGKTTSARILAKVLNCDDPRDGEPCCECASCTSVEAGTSYDVHELDAASNNGVDAMRDLIEKASLGTPGRHKVYILDEVHMLSKGAEAALLKTLEEPPPHVVFVLATTDPQKMSDTIRSRTQHLQFHLLGADTLSDHVRWVAGDAGLTVSDRAIEEVIDRGAGSPRDALSALELIANGGGEASEVIALDEFVEAMIDQDPGRALKVVARAIASGRDPRTVTEELIGFLRNGFLSLMAPELVQLPSGRLEAITDLAGRLGAAGSVRGIEHLGAALTEMRQAPDPRVLLDVATVRLTSPEASSDLAAIASRLDRLERRVAEGVPQAPTPIGTADAPADPAASGSRATRTAEATRSGVDAGPAAGSPSAEPDGRPAATTRTPGDGGTGSGRRALGSRLGASGPGAATPTPTPADPSTGSGEPAGSSRVAPGAPRADDRAHDQRAADEPASDRPAVDQPASEPDPVPAARATGQVSASDWEAVRPSLKGMARAVYSPATYVGATGDVVTLALPNETHRAKCEEHRLAVETAIGARSGAPVTVELVVEGGGDDRVAPDRAEPERSDRGAAGSDRSADAVVAAPSPSAPRPPSAPDEAAAPSAPVSSDGTGSTGTGSTGSASAATRSARPPAGSGSGHGATSGALAHDPVSDEPEAAPGDPHLRVVHDAAVPNGREIADRARTEGPGPDPDAGWARAADELPDDDEIDVHDLVDAPPESVKTPIDRLAEAFPGSELVDDPI